MIDGNAWRGRRVFLTGHTGFKGAWTALLLQRLGAEVTGFAFPPEHPDGIFSTAKVPQDMRHLVGDIRDADLLRSVVEDARPQIVIHMAAQALVRRSYAAPTETYATNIMGTVNLLEAVRRSPAVQAVIIVTSDKCYENVGQTRGYREGEPLGGADPYSSSKACAELVVDAYRRSFFNEASSSPVASARAGNVIGGGDWAQDRLVPDAIRAFCCGQVLDIRNPQSLRPWQHVLDPIFGYIMLAERLMHQGRSFAEPWNFGPDPEGEIPVGKVADMLVRAWGRGANWRHDTSKHPPEATLLKLDCSKAAVRLGWRPLFDISQAVELTIDWYRALQGGADMRSVSLRQIEHAMATTEVQEPSEQPLPSAPPSTQF